MNRLEGKTALVTGGSRGIGRAAVMSLAREGAQVIIHYGRAKKEAEAIVAEIVGNGGRAQAVSADMATPEGPPELAQKVRAIVGDRLDILVANAGISIPASIEDTKVADFDQLFAVNVRAPFFVIQQLLPILTEGSSVIVTTSLAAHAAVEGIAAYSMTKGALDTMVKHFALTLGARGIRLCAQNSRTAPFGCWTPPPRRLRVPFQNFFSWQRGSAATWEQRTFAPFGMCPD